MDNKVKLELYIIPVLKLSTVLNGYLYLRILVFTNFLHDTWFLLLFYYSLGEIPTGVNTGSGMELQGTVQFMGPHGYSQGPELTPQMS